MESPWLVPMAIPGGGADVVGSSLSVHAAAGPLGEGWTAGLAGTLGVGAPEASGAGEMIGAGEAPPLGARLSQPFVRATIVPTASAAMPAAISVRRWPLRSRRRAARRRSSSADVMVRGRSSASPWRAERRRSSSRESDMGVRPEAGADAVGEVDAKSVERRLELRLDRVRALAEGRRDLVDAEVGVVAQDNGGAHLSRTPIAA